ncbi:MAG: bifunctional adenosylcobinamide kinase/adenosylcobinamide-phosphate guanylyltransferase [Clostridiaceae bacterium]|nr:bifunctional adenosylcobinamide kinase/adenosylcobinamide-phosphate guanylyltransferase [Clostridiaceae bacterium]
MRILLTGGSACGKSTYAEKLAMRFSTPRYYIATMRIYDEESRKKVERHRQMRKTKNFITIERDTDIHLIELSRRGTVLLECMCNLTANEMFDRYGNITDVYNKIISGIESLASQCENLIVVTNDVGSDGGKYDESTQEYIRTLGRLNISLAERFDCVYEMVCGIPIVLKGRLL